jgi:hypothetical protein
MEEQGLPVQGMHDFGQTGFHPFPQPRRQNDYANSAHDVDLKYLSAIITKVRIQSK